MAAGREIRDVLSALVGCVAMRHAAEKNAEEMVEMENLQRRLWEAEISSSAHPAWILPPAGVSRRRSSRGEMTLSVVYGDNGDDLIPPKPSTQTKNSMHDTEGENRQAPSQRYCAAAKDAGSQTSPRNLKEQRRTSDMYVKPRMERAQSLSAAKFLFDEAHAHHNNSSGRSGHGSEFSQSGEIFRYPYFARVGKKLPRRNPCDGRSSSAEDRTLRKTASSPYPYKLDEDVSADEVRSDWADIGHEHCPGLFAAFHFHNNDDDDYSSNNNTSQYDHSHEPSQGTAVDSSAENSVSRGIRPSTEHSTGSRNRTTISARGRREPLRGSTWLGPEVSSRSCQQPGGSSKPQSAIHSEATVWPALNRSSGRWSSNAMTDIRRQAPSGAGDGRRGSRGDSMWEQRWQSQAKNRASVVYGGRNCGARFDAGRKNGAPGVSPRFPECRNEKGDTDCSVSECTWRSSCNLAAKSLRPRQSSSPRWFDDGELSTGCRWHPKDIPRGSNGFSRETEACPCREKPGPTITLSGKGKPIHLGETDESGERSGRKRETFSRVEESAGERGKPLEATFQGKNRLIRKDDHDSTGENMCKLTGKPPQVGTSRTAVNTCDDGVENYSRGNTECRKGGGVSSQQEAMNERIFSSNEVAREQAEQASVVRSGRAVCLSSRLPSTTNNDKPWHVRQSLGRPSSHRNDRRVSSSSAGNTPRHESSVVGSSAKEPGTVQRSGPSGPPSNRSWGMSLTAVTGAASSSSIATAAAAAAVATTTFPFSTPGLVSSVVAMRDSSSARYNGRPQKRPNSQQQWQQQQSLWQLSPSSPRQRRNWNVNGTNDDRGDHSEASELPDRHLLALTRRLKQLVELESRTIQWERLPRRERERLDRKQRLISSRFRVTERTRQENSLPVYRYSAASTPSATFLFGNADSSGNSGIGGGDGSSSTPKPTNTGRAVHPSTTSQIDHDENNLIEVMPPSDSALSGERSGVSAARTVMGSKDCVGLGGGRGCDRRACESGDSAPLVVFGSSAVADAVTPEGRGSMNQRYLRS